MCTLSACVQPKISCFHSILIALIRVLQGPGRHYCVAFCEAFNVVAECGEKNMRRGASAGGEREFK